MPNQCVQIRCEAGHKLTRQRALVVCAGSDEFVANALAIDVDLADVVDLDEVRLIVIVGPKQRPCRWCASFHWENDHKTICNATKRRVIAIGWDGEIAGRCAPTNHSLAGRCELHAVGRISPNPAEERRPFQRAQVRRQPKQDRIRGASRIHWIWCVHRGEIRRPGDAGHPRTILVIHVDLSPKHVAVVVGQKLPLVHAGKAIAPPM